MNDILCYVEVKWSDVQNGESVYLKGTHAGEFKAYGPHKVSNKERRELENSKGQRFLHYPEELMRLLPDAAPFDLLRNAIELAASEVYQWWQDAAGDMGYYFEPGFGSGNADRMYKEFLKTCENETIAREAMADWFHSDIQSIVDCCGDRVYDETTQILNNPAGFAKGIPHHVVFIAICAECRDTQGGHDWKMAFNRMIVEEKNHQAKMAKKRLEK